MELRVDGKVEFRDYLISFDKFTRMLRDFDNVEINYWDSIKEIMISFNHDWDTLSFKNISKDSENYKYLQEILKIYEEYKDYKRQRELYEEALNKGVVPKDERDKKLLINYLNELISYTEPLIQRARKNRVKHIIYSVAGGALAGGGLFALTGAEVSGMIISALFPVGGVGMSLATNYEDKSEIKRLEENLATYYKILNDVKGVKGNNPLEQEISENEIEDNNKIKKYNDRIIEEVREIIELINQLPFGERLKYRSEVDDLLSEYKRKVQEILEDDSNTVFILGRARDIYALNMEMLPKLHKIEIDLIFRLQERKDLEDVKEQIDDTKVLLYKEEVEKKGLKIG